MFDIEGIFESHEEAALFLQSIGKNPVPISDALDHRNGAVERIIGIQNSPTKPLELGFYGTFRPENSLEIPTLLLSVRILHSHENKQTNK